MGFLDLFAQLYFSPMHRIRLAADEKNISRRCN